MLRTYLVAGAMLIVSIVYGGPAVAQQLTAGATYVWVNELGSKMTTSWGADGLITGTYVSAVGCGAGTVRPLTGWWNNAAITFTVIGRTATRSRRGRETTVLKGLLRCGY